MKLLKSLTVILFLTILSTSCSTKETATVTYWVNSVKADCDAGAGKTKCLQVYKGNNLENAKWSYFYAPIENFEFEFGYLQKIEVTETPKDKSNTPADASSIAYKLVNVLEKKKDPKMALHDIWAATHVNSTAISNTNNRPNLEINVANMQALGTDGCNNYTGQIKKITDTAISFGVMASTKKMCVNSTEADSYNKALANTTAYKRENLILTFFDVNGNETLRFKKVD
ncbi:DUF4377 domain-containing protein [Algibacter pectinivorans]|uniref:Heat shock protein HslJ n=1 Tax=Algibacter pectinivorans TaxID=870482 RepID=A0A1I1RBD3_9FLAO|nr:DUF4377 domain-containing protein [Algibacter pectinivorans]SFD31575.1 Heat shock protein HslJ [Algibacter pectinivorans]